jgi:ATP diphosphatase
MASIEKLLKVMAALRDPQTGCPWDIDQDFASIAPYTIEEAYEVADAIERGALNELKDELGDLLLQVVFHARMAEEAGLFDFAAVVEAIAAKMIRRHPHVFAGESIESAEAQTAAWEAQKAAERAERGEEAGVLSDIASNLPALTWAEKTGKRAARVGFDWPHAEGVLAKIREELGELEQAREANSAARVQEEFGDLLLAMTSLARHLDLDPEQALREANRKFTRRFEALEASLAADQVDWNDQSPAELDARWRSVK